MKRTREEILKEFEDVENGIRYYTEELKANPNEEWIQTNYKFRLDKNKERLEELKKEFEEYLKNTVEIRKFGLMEGGCFIDTYRRKDKLFDYTFNCFDAEFFNLNPEFYDKVIRDVYENRCEFGKIDRKTEPFEEWNLVRRVIPMEKWKDREFFANFGIKPERHIEYIEGEKEHGKK